MEQAFKLLKIACPSCGSAKELKIPDSIFSEKKIGFIKIQVPQGAVCNDHNFMVLADPKGKVLGYETFDVAISKYAPISLGYLFCYSLTCGYS